MISEQTYLYVVSPIIRLNINLPFLKLELVLEIVTGLSLQIWVEDQGLLGIREEGCRAKNLEGGEKNCPMRSIWRVRLLQSNS